MWRVSGEEGATSAEYGLFLALIAAVIVGVVAAVGQDTLALFQSVEGRF